MKIYPKTVSENSEIIKECDFMRISVNETIGVIEVWVTANEANETLTDACLSLVYPSRGSVKIHPLNLI